MTEHLSEEVKKDRKLRGHFARQNETLREKVTQEYVKGLNAGTPDAEIRLSLMERFDIKTPRRLENMIRRQVGNMSPAAAAMTEAMIVRQFTRVAEYVEDLVDYIDEYVDDLESNDEDRVWTEEKEGGKADGVKYIPKKGAIKALLQEKVKAAKDAIDTLKVLRPETVIKIDNRKSIDEISDADLNRKLKISTNKD